MSFMQAFKQRGFFHQCTHENELEDLMTKTTVPCYIGFDCTATSLHVGSLMQIMILRMLQQHGHKPIVLLGGGTTRIGDPTGKDQARKMLSDEDIDRNMAGIRTVLEKYIQFGSGPTDAILVNNADWLSDIKYLDFLRDVGPHFSVNRMLTMDSVKLRLEREQNLSFLEFNYMLLQAYDYVVLNKEYGCRLQIGGSDQWGNIISGVELGRRLGAEDLFGLTTPLLTTATGAKMGKTESGAIWLSEDLLSPYEFWQFWRNTDDRDVARFLRFFTELPSDEMNRLSALEGAEINDAKRRLATEVTTLCHGREAALKAEETAHVTFAQQGQGEDLPILEIGEEELHKGIQAFDLFKRADLAQSGGESRKLIRGGGAKINDKPCQDELYEISHNDMQEGVIKLSAGKKRHVIVKIK